MAMYSFQILSPPPPPGGPRRLPGYPQETPGRSPGDLRRPQERSGGPRRYPGESQETPGDPRRPQEIPEDLDVSRFYRAAARFRLLAMRGCICGRRSESPRGAQETPRRPSGGPRRYPGESQETPGDPPRTQETPRSPPGISFLPRCSALQVACDAWLYMST